jgi:hypothetical protein
MSKATPQKQTNGKGRALRCALRVTRTEARLLEFLRGISSEAVEAHGTEEKQTERVTLSERWTPSAITSPPDAFLRGTDTPRSVTSSPE